MKLIRICVAGCILVFSSALLSAQPDVERKALLLEKEIFSADNDSVKDNLLLEKGLLLKKSGRPGEALFSLQRIGYKTADPDFAFRVLYNMALLSYAESKFESADFYLNEIRFYSDTKINNKEFLFLETLVKNITGEFEQARNSLSAYQQACGCSLNIDSLYSSTTRLKDPDKARSRSGLIPGLGQIYTGYAWKGVNSFLLNASFLGLVTVCINNQLYLTAAFSGLNLFAGFYRGGKRNAEHLARRRNAETIDSLNSFLLRWSENCN
ncbi:MAG: hypothetical protein ACOC4R_00320 [Bacteroidota bacterium]